MKDIRVLAVAGLLAVASCSASTSDVTGRVLEVEGDLENVTGFILVTDDGDRLDFVTPLEADRIDFPLIHLRDHVLSAEPVVVIYETRGGVLFVIRVDDAPPGR
ncbi:MAG: hypothetical protein ACE5MI_07400 [Acidimicrobiia bacterium]